MSCGEPEIWKEPHRGGYPPRGLLGLPGLERLQRGPASGFPRPPMHHLTGLVPVASGYGFSEFEMPAHAWFRSPFGVFPGGVAAIVADAPLGTAIMSTVPPGRYTTTTELSLTFLRPMSVESERLRARAELIQAGRNLGVSQAFITDAKGTLVAHATTRCAILTAPSVPEPRLDPVEQLTYDTPDPWQRPSAGGTAPLDALRTMTGLELLKGVIDGALPHPPFAHLFSTRAVEADEGRAVFATTLSPWLHSPAGNVYGGITAMLADNVLGAACLTTLPPDTPWASLDLKVQYLRPVFGDGSELIARAEVVHRGRTLAVARAELVNSQGKTVALATGSCMVLPDRSYDELQPLVTPDDGVPDEHT